MDSLPSESLFIYLAALGLCCCTQAFSSCSERGLLVAVQGLLTVMASLVAGFPCGSAGKESACSVGDQVQSLGWGDLLEEGMATHSSILAWRIPRPEEPGGLQSMESQRGTK